MKNETGRQLREKEQDINTTGKHRRTDRVRKADAAEGQASGRRGPSPAKGNISLVSDLSLVVITVAQRKEGENVIQCAHLAWMSLIHPSNRNDFPRYTETHELSLKIYLISITNKNKKLILSPPLFFPFLFCFL